jgi:hypothetical protein
MGAEKGLSPVGAAEKHVANSSTQFMRLPWPSVCSVAPRCIKAIGSYADADSEAPMKYIATISTRGRVTIPIQLHRKLGWMKRMKVFIRDVNGVIWIAAVRDVKRPGGNRRR